ncbi:VPS62 protein, partial [Acromyrmex heyeri]
MGLRESRVDLRARFSLDIYKENWLALEPRVRDALDPALRRLVRDWAPLVWLAPGEQFLPLGVTEFLDNVQSDQYYLRTRIDIESLLQNRSSFLYGRRPAGAVPVYALVKNCISKDMRLRAARNMPMLKTSVERNVFTLIQDPGFLAQRQTNSVSDLRAQILSQEQIRQAATLPRFEKVREESGCQKVHFHVTYWMFYPFSEGKTICVLDLGFFGSWPIPTIGGVCIGTLKEYGSHIGDWEHMSLYFKDNEYPLAMYVSAHDVGAFYQYDPRNGTFIYESQETRKGLFQKPTFPEKVYTAGDSHPILFSARGSHGLWTAPGKHKFVRVPRLYDESGFGTAWPTWKRLELLLEEDNEPLPGWMTFKGKWGNPRSNCHPLARLGFNICEFVDGPTGIPMKKFNFRC